MWTSSQGVVVGLVETKAKLTALELKGDPVKAKVCSTVFATRLRKYFEKYGWIKIKKWFHLVDSQIVLRAIQHDSYGYQTFFANRIGEIQKKGASSDWWWIQGICTLQRSCEGQALKILTKIQSGRMDRKKVSGGKALKRSMHQYLRSLFNWKF